MHYFEAESAFTESYNSGGYIEPWVSYTEGKGLDYNKPDYTKVPFIIEALGSGNITWKLGTKTVQYSKNGCSWETMDSGTTISVAEGDEIQFKGTNTDYCGNTISATTQFNVRGNIMSLTDGDDFETADTVNANGFRDLFSGCTYLVSACDLKLPSTTLASSCYYGMFRGCTGLTAAPELPATTLASNCYDVMFYSCTSLTTAPELPATTLAGSCYNYMFYGCTSLTTAPELPATTLSGSCYNNMFRGCTSLTTAPELPATTLASSCYYGMFYGCTSLTSAPELPATTLASSCYYCMFQGCTRITTAPELPATALTNNCYKSMFQGCTSLNYIKAMFKTTPSTSYTGNWVSGVASRGTFVKNSAATWNVTGANGVPTYWTVETSSE